MTRRGRFQGCYNRIAALFVLLSAGVIVLTGLLLAGAVHPPAGLIPLTPTLPAVLALPSETPSATPSATHTATFTATATPTATATATVSHTPTATDTPTPTPTASATATPTATPITPSATPSATPSPTITATSTPSATPTRDPAGPTDTPTPAPTPDFPFVLEPNTPAFTAYTGPEGCNYQGLGGLVLGLQKERLARSTGLQIFITASTGFSKITPIENDPVYGWLVKLDNKPNRLTYEIELRTPDGIVLSPRVVVTFDGRCADNLALVNLSQSRPY